MSQGRAGRKRAWECIGRREDADRERARDLERAGLLSSWNARVEAALVCLFTQAMQAGEGLDEYAVPAALLEEGSVPLRHWWGQWLWGCDPMQACSVNAPMNECQLHGLLVARSLVALYPAVMTDGVGLQDVFGASSRLCLGPGPVSGLNVRELKDCVLNLRQNWAAERGWEAPGAKDALMLILARLGVLSSTVMPSTSVCDDEYLQPCRGRKAVEMTRAGVRRVLNVVMALFRSMHVHGAAQEWSPSGEGEVQRVSKHHIFAGVDDFAGLSMQWDLPPAAVLNYVHDFPGMYNHVSQVIYFLNPSYAKRGFKPPSVESVMDGSCGELHSLPSILQLFPDIPVLLSDAAMDLRPDGDWGGAGSSWLILDERVFLVSCEGQGVFRNSSRLVALTGLLLRAALKKGCDPSRQGLPAG